MRAQSIEGDWAISHGQFVHIPNGTHGQSFYGENNVSIAKFCYSKQNGLYSLYLKNVRFLLKFYE